MDASVRARSSVNVAESSSTSAEKAPYREAVANVAAVSVSALIRSAIASA